MGFPHYFIHPHLRFLETNVFQFQVSSRSVSLTPSIHRYPQAIKPLPLPRALGSESLAVRVEMGGKRSPGLRDHQIHAKPLRRRVKPKISSTRVEADSV